jgi:pyruvate formate lyase activating enzyme
MGQLYEIQPFTMLDYPGETACIAWFAGCNFRCVYCHNPAIVKGKGEKEDQELLDFLGKRVGRLTGVVFSGGEPTLSPSLLPLARKAKEMGYKIKLDTNGSNPDVVELLYREGVLDYVALDYKCPAGKAVAIIGTQKFIEPFRQTLKQLIAHAKEGLSFEVRTTFHPDLMDETDLTEMMEDLDELGFQGTYYIQGIASTGEDTLGHIAKPSRTLEKDRLPTPKNFKVMYRNFPDEKKD